MRWTDAPGSTGQAGILRDRLGLAQRDACVLGTHFFRKLEASGGRDFHWHRRERPRPVGWCGVGGGDLAPAMQSHCLTGTPDIHPNF